MSLTFLVVPALFGLLIAILVIQIRIYRGMRKLPGGEALAPLVRPGFGWKLWGGLNLLYWAVFAGSLRLSFHTFRELDIQIGQFHEGVAWGGEDSVQMPIVDGMGGEFPCRTCCWRTAGSPGLRSG